MNSLDIIKKNQFNSIFFIAKILALLFCAAPLFQYFFSESTSGALENINLPAIIISLIIISIITFMWIIMSKSYSRLANTIEIITFFVVCVASIAFSGAYTSYYKFLFIFLVVAYTIQININVGFAISIASSVFILSMDIIMYPKDGVNPFFQADIALCAMFMAVAWILGFYVKLERKHINKLKGYANYDGLTGVFNHRYFHDIFEEKCKEAIENKFPISLIVLDIDRFKLYNDMYGHQKGDKLLKIISKILRNNVDATDIISRYGGDEFVIIVPYKAKEKAKDLAENIRKYIENYKFEGEEHLPEGKITVSIGIADLLNENDDHIKIINRADSALYKAKFLKRNHVEVYSSVFDDFGETNHTASEALTSVKSLIAIINSRDFYTYNHTERVVWYCKIFSKYLKIDKKDSVNLLYAAYLHDIGKINIAKNILISENPLSEEEWSEMKKHPVDSAQIVGTMEGLSEISDIVLQHHERIDGKGYPNNLKGDEILYLSKMLTIADAFDAMTAKRPYQDTKTFQSAFEELRSYKDTQFDGALVEKFIEAMEKEYKY